MMLPPDLLSVFWRQGSDRAGHDRRCCSAANVELVPIACVKDAAQPRMRSPRGAGFLALQLFVVFLGVILRRIPVGEDEVIAGHFGALVLGGLERAVQLRVGAVSYTHLTLPT